MQRLERRQNHAVFIKRYHIHDRDCPAAGRCGEYRFHNPGRCGKGFFRRTEKQRATGHGKIHG